MRRLMILALLLPVLAVAQVVSFVSSPSAAPAGSTLSNSLIAFWKFDGNWEDSVGSNDLKPSGSPYVSATGKSGQAASFEKDSTQYAYINDNADLSFSDTENFTIAGWIKTESLLNQHMAGKNTEYSIGLRNNNLGRFYSSGALAVQTSNTVSLDTWAFLCAWYNVATDSLYLSINNGTIAMLAATEGPTDGTNAFFIGTGITNYFFDGLIDDLGVWTRSGNYTVGKAFRDSLYNSGNGWRP